MVAVFQTLEMPMVAALQVLLFGGVLILLMGTEKSISPRSTEQQGPSFQFAAAAGGSHMICINKLLKKNWKFSC